MNGFIVAAEATTMTTFLSTMGEVATWIFDKVGTVGQTIMDTPYLLVTTGVMLTGAAIGIFGRLLRKS